MASLKEFVEYLRESFGVGVVIMMLVGAGAFAFAFINFIGVKLSEATNWTINWTSTYAAPINTMWGPTTTTLILMGVMVAAIPAVMSIVHFLRGAGTGGTK